MQHFKASLEEILISELIFFIVNQQDNTCKITLRFIWYHSKKCFRFFSYFFFFFSFLSLKLLSRYMWLKTWKELLSCYKEFYFLALLDFTFGLQVSELGIPYIHTLLSFQIECFVSGMQAGCCFDCSCRYFGTTIFPLFLESIPKKA